MQIYGPYRILLKPSFELYILIHVQTHGYDEEASRSEWSNGGQTTAPKKIMLSTTTTSRTPAVGLHVDNLNMGIMHWGAKKDFVELELRTYLNLRT